MTGPVEGQIPAAPALRKCNACPRMTAGCGECKEFRAFPYDHLCRFCHTTALGGAGHEWQSAATARATRES